MVLDYTVLYHNLPKISLLSLSSTLTPPYPPPTPNVGGFPQAITRFMGYELALPYPPPPLFHPIPPTLPSVKFLPPVPRIQSWVPPDTVNK